MATITCCDTCSSTLIEEKNTFAYYKPTVYVITE